VTRSTVYARPTCPSGCNSRPARIRTAAFCRGDLDDHLIVTAAKKRGINVSPLSMQYRHGNPRQGLVLGYAATPVNRMAAGVQELRAAILEVAK
jgi:GntR family transcriptional regulator/MocR family aminotransferase